jgi:ATP-dependent DNA helicase RecQ
MVSSQEALALLRATFGFGGFRPGQSEALGHLLAGRHTLVVMPTGAGKSLIYQLAALMRPGLTVVVSPLIALMKDQVDALVARNLPATLINSTLPQPEQQRRLQAMRQGAYRMVYVSPERLRSRAFVHALAGVSVGLLAVDEAHCISQWGHDFRPDYLHIGPCRETMGLPTTAALTATATPQVQADIIGQLRLQAAQRVITGFNRANLTLDVRYTPSPVDKLRALASLLSDTKGAGIIYAGTRRDAEEVAEFVQQELGLAARHYHAGLSAEQRSEVQDAFMSGALPLVVATNAFGMGVDRADLRFVIHFALPGTLEAYYQEAGRAGRDGLPARCTLLFCPQDRALQEWFIDNEIVDTADVRQLHALLATKAATKPSLVDTADLALATGMRNTALRLALSLLERAGALQRLGDEGTRLWVQTARLREDALSAALKDAERRQRHRRHQLGQMIAYAEGDVCRRRVILAHFGDTGPVEAPDCCDVCRAKAAPSGQARQANTATEKAALTALAAVAEARWNVGRKLLAQILKGSTAQKVTARGYDRQPHYGKLSALRLDAIETLISELVRTGHLKVTGSDRPLVQITAKGRQALTNGSAIAVGLSLPPSIRQQAPLQTRGHPGATVSLTGELVAKGLSPAQIAAQRNLTLATVYEHAALLIAAGRLTVDQVVRTEAQAQIQQALAKSGDTDRLAPITALLPGDISYGEIRCVIAASKPQAATPAPKADQDDSCDLNSEAVFEALRSWRLEQSRRQDLPAFCIFHDSTLREIARRQPGTLEELRAIKNVGPSKLKAYGDAALEVLSANRQPIGQTLVQAGPEGMTAPCPCSRTLVHSDVDKAVLACVETLGHCLPRSGVAKLLVGSQSQRVAAYRGHALFASLRQQTRDSVMARVDALLAAGHMAADDRGYLVLTSSGRALLSAPPPVSEGHDTV